ncbi:hypothetical protein GJ496_010178 [Pomphorhynchus laevis]|nr:hypothetical protein GJ496_010178 [Pomphorhynchus laevis]
MNISGGTQKSKNDTDALLECQSYQSDYSASISSDEDDDLYEKRQKDVGSTHSNSSESGKPQILLMGLRGSGKSSIIKVVFHQMAPHETLFLENTKFVIKDDISWSSFIHFQVQDFPGQMDIFEQVFDSEKAFNSCGALIFVIDSQDDYTDALHKLCTTVHIAYAQNQGIKFEIFIHKIDGLTDDQKIECQRDIHQRVTEDLSDLSQINISFYLSTIYDHSIFEAFSKVVQKLIPRLPMLENMLNVLIGNCGIEKAFLFDVISKIYIATDSSPVDMQTYELCCDMIKVVMDLSTIYGSDPDDLLKIPLDSNSQSVITLANSNVLWLKQVNNFVVLVCLLREDGMSKRGLIEHNFAQFKMGLDKILDLEEEERLEVISKSRQSRKQKGGAKDS